VKVTLTAWDAVGLGVCSLIAACGDEGARGARGTEGFAEVPSSVRGG
jgi:hypothetical protein